ncbi:hypothetical protein J132_07197 [Termitomyces sp. J132]|nr:hypothetical protein H2248_004251 [Termitomyces sp. 'cryptogamus']KNZ74340.1 hypothetical protein J132_07197 [Termitomyces sp. J132]
MEIFTILSKLQTWAPTLDALNVLGYTFFLTFTARFLEASHSAEVTSPSPRASGTPTISLTPTPTSCVVPPLPTPWLCLMLVLIGVALPTVRLVYPTRRSTPSTSFSSVPISTSIPSFTTRSKVPIKPWYSTARLKTSSCCHGQTSTHMYRILAFIFSKQSKSHTILSILALNISLAVRAICYGLIVSQCTPAMHAVFPLSLSATSATHLPILTGVLTVLATLYPALRIFVVNFNQDKTTFNHKKSTAHSLPSSASKTEKYDQDQDLDANAGAELDDRSSSIFFIATPPSPTNTDTSSNYVRRWLEDVHHAGLEHFPEFDGDTPRNIDNDTASEVLDWYRIFDEHQTEKAADADSDTDELENQDEEWVVFHTLMDEEVLGTDEQHMDELHEERDEHEAFLMLTNLAGEDELSTSNVGLDEHHDQAQFSDHPSLEQVHGLECASSAVRIDDELSSSDADVELRTNQTSIIQDDAGSVNSATVISNASSGVVDDKCIDTSDIEDNRTSSVDVDVEPSTLLSSSCIKAEVQRLPTADTDIQSPSDHHCLFFPTGEADVHHSSTIGGEPIVLSSLSTELDIPAFSSDIQVDSLPSNGELFVLSSSSIQLDTPAFPSDVQVNVSPSDNEYHSLPSNTLEDGSDCTTYEENTHIESHPFETRNINSSPLTLADLEIWGTEYELTLPEDESYTSSMISASPSPTPFTSQLLDSTSQSWEALFDANEAMLLDSGTLLEGQLDLASELQGAEFDNSSICFINDDVSFLISEDPFVPPTKEDASIIHTILPLSQSSTFTSEAAPLPSKLTSSTSTFTSSIPIASKPPAPRPKIRSSILGLMDAPRAARGSGSWR